MNDSYLPGYISVLQTKGENNLFWVGSNKYPLSVFKYNSNLLKIAPSPSCCRLSDSKAKVNKDTR